jgi:hypothetical protein
VRSKTRAYFLPSGIHNAGELNCQLAFQIPGEHAMTNRSFSDLSAGERRERIAAILAAGLLRNLAQRSKISANSGNQSLEVCSDLGLSVSQPDFEEADDVDEV